MHLFINPSLFRIHYNNSNDASIVSVNARNMRVIKCRPPSQTIEGTAANLLLVIMSANETNFRVNYDSSLGRDWWNLMGKHQPTERLICRKLIFCRFG